MHVTNTEKMPDLLYQALAENRPPVEGEIHVTQLIGPPMLDYLRRKHWDDLKQDASERLYALMGQAMHAVLANDGRLQYAKAVLRQLHDQWGNYSWDTVKDIIRDLIEKISEGSQRGIESSMRVTINKKWTLVGTDDYFDEDVCILRDWKMTSVWSVVFADHDWEEQLNVYAWMRRQLGYDVKNLEVWALLRDWQKYKAKYGGDSEYPKIPFVCVPIKLWTEEKQEKYINMRLRKFSGKPVSCSPKEKWQTPTTYKVMKGKNKTAAIATWFIGDKRVPLLSTEEARSAAQKKNLPVDGKKIWIKEFKGESKRCDMYCPVNKYCKDYVPKEAQNAK